MKKTNIQKFFAASLLLLSLNSVFCADIVGYEVLSPDDIVPDGLITASGSGTDNVYGIRGVNGITAGIGSGISVDVNVNSSREASGIMLGVLYSSFVTGDISASSIKVSQTGSGSARGIQVFGTAGTISGLIDVSSVDGAACGIEAQGSSGFVEGSIGDITADTVIRVTSNYYAAGLRVDTGTIYGRIEASGGNFGAAIVRYSTGDLNVKLGGNAYISGNTYSIYSSYSSINISGDENMQTLKGDIECPWIGATSITFNKGNFLLDSFNEAIRISVCLDSSLRNIIMNDGAKLIFAKSGVLEGTHLQFFARDFDDHVSMTLLDGSSLTLTDGMALKIVLADDFDVNSAGTLNFIVNEGEGSIVGTFGDLEVVFENGTVVDSSLYTFDSATGSLTFVPEPSTYAAIFGALVLALAVYRRRK